MRLLFLVTLASSLPLFALGVENPNYTIKSKLRRDDKTLLFHIDLQTLNDARINQEAPVTLEIRSFEGLQFTRTKFSKDDLRAISSNSLKFEIPTEETKTSSTRAKARIVFYLCFKSSCKKIEHDLTAS